MKKIVEKLDVLGRKCAWWTGFASAVCVYAVVHALLSAPYADIVTLSIFTGAAMLAYYRAYQRWRAYSRLQTLIPQTAISTLYQQAAVANAMQKYGGSFAAALGAALGHADPNNAQRIRDGWPDEWDKYLNLSKTGDDDAGSRR